MMNVQQMRMPGPVHMQAHASAAHASDASPEVAMWQRKRHYLKKAVRALVFVRFYFKKMEFLKL